MNVKTLKSLGFTQRKPAHPGIYFIRPAVVPEFPNYNTPRRLWEGWEIAVIYFRSGGYPNTLDNHREDGYWYIETLGGLCHAWKPGMWTKGPIRPDWTAPAREEAAHE